MNEQQFQDEQKVVVTCQITDIRMPFWSMVVFMVKLVFASIPALIVICAFVGFLLGGLVFLFGTMPGFHGMSHSFRFPF